MDDYLDSPMDADDVFPCKGCGEVGFQRPWKIPRCSRSDSVTPPDPRGRESLRTRYVRLAIPKPSRGGRDIVTN